jgi:hypothetical protein
MTGCADDEGSAGSAATTEAATGVAGEGSTDGASATGVDSETDPALLQDAVNGMCAPEGERFTDVYSCEFVVAPLGDASIPASAKLTDPDPGRLADPDREWVDAQLAACSCSCCHATPGASLPVDPSGRGRYVWDATFAPIWTDSATSDALRGVGGLNGGPTHTSVDPDDNFGFERHGGSAPTTDYDRLSGFIERELARRGE